MQLPLRFEILKNEITYTGSELRPHWVLEKTKNYGSTIAAFIGPCEVKTGELVDMEDRLAEDFIRSKKMLHMIAEFYGTTLEAGVLYQRLLMDHAARALRESGFATITREGDDLMVDGAKLSVSIATASPVSVLIHWGLNIDATGAPVKAIGLSALNWSDSKVLDFAKALLAKYILEVEDIIKATVKVRCK